VTLIHVPQRGIQPQAEVDAKGRINLVYFSGPVGHGDLYYARSADGCARFFQPLRVNSEPNSTIAIGNIRGGHIALGSGARVHVAWIGSDKARPRGPCGATPMLYTRLNDLGNAFE
jgi:hypothetical protein